MSSVDVVSLYQKFGNLFKISCLKMGTVYEVDNPAEDTIDKGALIRFNGRYYSYKKAGNENTAKLSQDLVLRFLGKNLVIALQNQDYEFPRHYRCYRPATDEVSQSERDIFKLFNGFTYQIIILDNDFYLCVDPRVIVTVVSSVSDFIKKGIPYNYFNENPLSVRYREGEEYKIDGFLIEVIPGKDLPQPAEGYFCKIKRYRKIENQNIDIVPAGAVYPENRPEIVQALLEKLGRRTELMRLIRRQGFLDSPTPSLDRFVQTLKRVEELSTSVFPLNFGDFTFQLEKQPIVVKVELP